jgi:acyl-CoA synthetase (NDP forming)
MNDKTDAHPDLETFFSPKSVAVIGASPQKSTIRGRLLDNLISNGYAGNIYPVNPSHEEVQGLKAYKSIDDVPEVVDFAAIVIPPKHVPATIEACAKKGVKFAYILSSGFAEGGEEGVALHHQVKDVLAKYPIRIAGPNSQGMFNIADGMAMTFSRVIGALDQAPTTTTGRVAVISQSGGLAFALLRGAKWGLDYSFVISTGNEIDLETLDFAHYALQRNDTDALIMFIEGFREPQKFRAIAEMAANAGKPLITAKVGRSEAGERATASHTAHLAGSDTSYQAMFDRYGVIRCFDPDDMISAALALTSAPLPHGNRVGMITVSGGNAIMMTDLCEEMNLDIPPLSETTQDKIRTVIPTYGSPQNPVDLTAQANYKFGTTTSLGQTVGFLVDDPDIDTVIVQQNMGPHGQMEDQGPEMAAHVKRSNKPVLLYSYTTPSEENVALLLSYQIPCYVSQRSSLHAIKALSDYGSFQQRWRDNPPPQAKPSSKADAALKLFGSAGNQLNELQSKELLRLYDLPVPQTATATSADEARQAFKEIGGAVVLKILSADIAHKTEAGGVVLNVDSKDAAARAFDQILKNVNAHAPKAKIVGVLLEEMKPTGIEMTAGLINDPDFGPMVMVGLGGIFIEVLKDVTFCPAPLKKQDAVDMIDRLKGAQVLKGTRGGPPADIDALADVLVKLSQIGIDLNDQFSEADLNPVIVYPEGQGICVVDAFFAKR